MSSSEVQVSDEVKKPEKMLNMRHTMAFLLFLATTVSYANRVSMSVAIVSMTQVNNATNHQMFDWNRATKDKILSSFFWGYIVLQIPAGMIAGRFGGKILIFVSMLSTGLINLLIPLAAFKGGWIAVCACRVGMGLTQGLLFPSIHGLLGQWVPVTERSRTGTFIYAGSQLGTILELAAAGALSDSEWGWPSIFYSVGICCIVYAAVWCIFGSSSPSHSKWISKEERKYIEVNTASTDLKEKKKLPTPWKSIWTSLPFWAILLAHSGQSLGFWTLLTEMPSYMESVLKVEIKRNGQLSALPYIAMYILSFVFSWTADTLVNRNILSLGWTRRIFNTIAFWGPGVALLFLSYVPPGNLALSVALLTITVGLNGAHFVGFLMSHIDLSPNFSSTLMGITNGIGNIFSIMAPLSVSMIIKDESSASEWRKVFFISIGFYFLSNLFYLLFMSGSVQSWNEPKISSHLEGDAESQKDKKHKNDQRTYQDTDRHF